MAYTEQDEANNQVYWENGRGYARYRRGTYLIPVDTREMERLDIMHTMILAARPKPVRLHHAPFIDKRDVRGIQSKRVLDLGFGTGVWLLDMAEKYRDVSFYGVDVNNMAPAQLLPNINVRTPIDFEDLWTLGEESFDLIHMAMGLGSVRNWPLLYEKIYRHVKPGGYFEHVEMDWTPRCDDGTLFEGPYTRWWTTYVPGPFDHLGCSLRYNPNTGHLLQAKGFVNIQHAQFRVPTNGWSTDRAEHVAGTWWENVMGFGESCGHGLEALSLAVMTRVNLWSERDAKRMCREAHAQATDRNVHAYNVLHVWWAQREPE